MRDDGGPKAGRGQLRGGRSDLLLLLARLQGHVRPQSREVRQVTRHICDSAAKIYPGSILLHAVSHGEGLRSVLWTRLTWSRALFAVLVLNVAWTASLFLCPFTVAPVSFVHQLAGAHCVDHQNIWVTSPLYAGV